jgi:hypothetical protein
MAPSRRKSLQHNDKGADLFIARADRLAAQHPQGRFRAITRSVHILESDRGLGDFRLAERLISN